MYKENVRVNEALSYHMEEGDKLKKIQAKLEKENESLKSEKEMNDMMIQEKVSQGKTQKQHIKQVRQWNSKDVILQPLTHCSQEKGTFF